MARSAAAHSLVNPFHQMLTAANMQNFTLNSRTS